MSRMRDRTDTKLYYSISEASAIAKVKPHVLRYWETQFKMLRPKKNKAGNRMYRRRDLRLIQLIKELLYDKGFTIAGARRKLLDDRTLVREQIEIKFTDADRSRMLLDVIDELKHLVRELSGRPAPDGKGNGRHAAPGPKPALDVAAPEREAIAAGFDDSGIDEPDVLDDDDMRDDGEHPGRRVAADE
jgi:DNA-binding transcriptional MerR regulator